MSIRLDLAQTQSLQVPDSDATTFPAGDWSLTWIAVFDGVVSGAGIQYVLCTGTYNALGAMNISYVTSATQSANGQIIVYPSSATSAGYGSVNRFTSGAYLFNLEKSGGNLVLRSCPILANAPADGSAVRTEFTVTAAASKTDVELNGTNGLLFGRRNDNSRYFGNSLARMSRVDAPLSNFELAQMAYGMEITELGKAPAWYFRLNDNADIADRGMAGLVMSAIRSPATGTAPAFGYDSSNPPSNVAPTISGAPTINGTPTAGQPIGYTPAGTTGIPAATRTQQWTIEGVDIAGATGTTYTPAAGDAGKALRVRQIATNSVGTTNATSAPVTVAAAVANSITANPLPAERIYPRTGTSAAINLSGTYTGDAPATIEYQLYAEDGAAVLRPWSALTAPIIGSGAWSKAQSIPQGGMYRIAVRAKNASGVVLGMSEVMPQLFGVGAHIGMIGSSGAQLLFSTTSADAAVTPRADVRVNAGNAWGVFANNCAAIILANRLAELLGVPVALFNYGVSGTGLDGWAATNSGLLNSLKNAVNAAGGRLEGCYITAGSNDAAEDGGVTGIDSHLGLERALVTNVRTNSNQPDLPICWVGINRRLSNESRSDQFNWARAAENILGDDANVTCVQALDYDLRDGVHLSGGANGYPALMARVAYQWGERLVTGTYRRGPKITSMVAEGNDVVVTLQHRGSSDFTPATGITGFTADTTINSVTRAAADKIRIACAAPPTTVRYLSGAAPNIGTPVYGNTATKLPMTAETQMSVLQSEPPGDTTAPTFTGTIAVSNITSSGATLTAPIATDNTGVAGYQVSTDAGANFINTASNVVTLSGLPSSTTINAQMRAYDAAMNYSAPLSRSFTTLAAADTTAPTLTGTVTVSSITDNGATLTAPLATDNVGVAGYQVSVNGGATYNNAPGRVIPLTGLPAGTAIAARVRAYDAAMNYSAALPANFTTLAATPDPDPGGAQFVRSKTRTIDIKAAPLTFSGGGYWNLVNPRRPVGSIDPNATIDITFNWTEVLADIQDEIATVQFDIIGLTNKGAFRDGAFATIFVANATGSPSITCRITTASTPPRIEDRTVYLNVEQQ